MIQNIKVKLIADNQEVIANKLRELGGVRILRKRSSNDVCVDASQDIEHVQQIVYIICACLLNNESISQSIELFEMGDSILAGQVIAQFKDTLGIKVTIRELFDHPTIEQIAAYIVDNDNAHIATEMANYILTLPQ